MTLNKYAQVEQLLSNYKMLEISIKNMKQEIGYLEQEDGMSGIAYDSVSTSPTNEIKSATEGTALSNMEKIHFLEHSIEGIKRKLESADRAMEGLTGIEREVVEQFYIEGKQWWQVAYGVGYSESQSKRHRKNAIRKIIVGMYGER